MEARGSVLGRQSEGVSGEEEIDRLSNLPEHLIDYILSFLPTEDVVRTSQLSTRWRHVWTQVTSLRLISSNKRRASRMQKFADFVYKVLLHQNPVLQEFHLHCSSDCGMVETWIIAVLRCKKVIKLDVSIDKTDLIFPSCLFDCDSLTGLKLRMRCKLRVPTQVCFLKLKTVELYEVSLFTQSSIGFNLPFLRILKFISCIWYDLKTLSVEAPVIECFTMYDPIFRRLLHSNIQDNVTVENAIQNCSMSIYGQYLRDLEFSFHANQALAHLILPQPSRVVNATVVTALTGPRLPPQQLQSSRLVSSPLLEQLPCLSCLTISGNIIESLEQPPYSERLPTFEKLTTLKVSLGVPFEAVLRFLHSCPILESLTFMSDIERWEEDRYVLVPRCDLSHLRFVGFQSFRADELNKRVVTFLLRQASALKEMHIGFSRVKRYKRMEVSRELRRSRPALSSARLSFYVSRKV